MYKLYNNNYGQVKKKWKGCLWLSDAVSMKHRSTLICTKERRKSYDVPRTYIRFSQRGDALVNPSRVKTIN